MDRMTTGELIAGLARGTVDGPAARSELRARGYFAETVTLTAAERAEFVADFNE